MSEVQLHVERRGTGFPTVWLHGWSAELGVWRDFPDIPGREAVLFDLPGHGRSPWTDDWTLDSLAPAVLSRIDYPADFVGWSLGGVLAAACALAEPAKVRSIAVLAMSNFGGERAERMRNSLAKNKLRALADFYGAVWSEADRAQPGFDQLQKDLARSRKLPPVEAMLGLYRKFSGAIPSLAIEKVTCPFLVAHGTGDSVTPMLRAEEIVQRITGAQLVRIEGAGHVPFLTFPDACHTILRDFWARFAAR
ncbi:MAG: alpha/beta fold hydrolase [Planctomycetota bacterium]